MRIPFVLALAAVAQTCFAFTNLPFGEYYPHTRWVDSETHRVTIDAFPHRLVITRSAKRPIVVRGCWRGRAFLRDCRRDYFGVAHEGLDASIGGDSRFRDLSFRRVRPDPKT